MRWPRAGSVAMAVAIVIATPASASAAIRYVATTGTDTGDCATPAAPCLTIDYAAGQANDGDTVQIGPGLFPEAVDTSSTLEFIGAGSRTFEEGGTDVRAPDSTTSVGPSAFNLPDGGVLRSLRAEGGDGADGSGFLDPGDPGGAAVRYASFGETSDQLGLDGVTLRGGDAGSGGVIPPPGGAGLLFQATAGAPSVLSVDESFLVGGTGFGNDSGVRVEGPAVSASFTESKLGSEFDTTPLNSALSVRGGADVTLESSVVTGAFGAEVSGGVLSIRRSYVVTILNSLVIQPTAGNPFAEAVVSNSLVDATETEAVRVASVPLGGSGYLIAFGSTFVAGGGEAAVLLESATPPPPLSAQLYNTVAYREPEGGATDLLADAGFIEAESSSFTTSLAKNGGTVPAPGSGTNIAGDPGFEGKPGSEYHLAAESPLIDRGDPGSAAEETDLKGDPRSVDGDSDCLARPDIGAFELTGKEAECPAPPSTGAAVLTGDPAPEVTAFGVTSRKFAPKGRPASRRVRSSAVKKGTTFTYSVSEPATVAIVIERRRLRKGTKSRWVRVAALTAQKPAGRGSTPFSGRVRGRPLSAGPYRARIVATDSAGQVSVPRQISLRVLRARVAAEKR